MTPSDYETVVYDLDGTLVRLAVDWDAAATDARALFAANGHEEDGLGLWAMLERADDHGLGDEFEALLAEHEREGARASTRCPRADDLPLSVPTGVCSLNCEAACRIALDRHELADAVDAVVGRDSVATHKPDPAPLSAVIERLGGRPATTLFVGDSERDELTAERAGVDFEYV
ncbi:HAD family hydrolase [Halobaculum sp. MBLA0147]|uniref:HAD family hydrolase n=1 Tax=Halobaculum sp. MBLA0147 TaxID=3079934 RepID=UPI00352340C6